jgi:hypothetical protein
VRAGIAADRPRSDNCNFPTHEFLPASLTGEAIA